MKFSHAIGTILLIFCILFPDQAQGQNGISNTLLLSVEAGFHTHPFYLRISSGTGDPVRFTLDGSVPAPGSAIFPDSLLLDDPSSKPNCFSEVPTTLKQSRIHYKAWQSPGKPVEKAHVLRCASFRNGNRTSRVYTRSYFIDEQVRERYSMPVISLVTDSVNLFDRDSGIYVTGSNFDPADPEWSGNYFMTGEDWEREVHIEYFTPQGDLGFSQDAGIRIHGGMTRQAAQKTLRLYARNEYGEKYFNYPLFPQKGETEYKRFLLRTSMGSWGDESVIKDVLAHEIVRDLDFEIQDFQPAIVFINGEYWGIHTIRDRIDERYIAYTSGYDKDSVDLINGNHTLVDAGSNEHYVELARFIAASDLSSDTHYDHVASCIDMSSFIDYMIARMYFADKDWPGNNQKLWRPQTPDGKWRWIFFDVDGGFGPHVNNMFGHAITGDSDADWQSQPVSSFLFRNLLKNARFTELFINRWEAVLFGEFRLGVMTGKLDSIRRLYKSEVPGHITRWDYPASYNSWERDLRQSLYFFLENRSCDVAREITGYFGLTDFRYSCGHSSDISDLLRLAPNPNRGSFDLINDSETAFIGKVVVSDPGGRIICIREYLYLGAGRRPGLFFPDLQWGSAISRSPAASVMAPNHW